MSVRYCLPLMEGSLTQVAKTIEAQASLYTFFELWLDLLDEVSLEAVRVLCRRWPDRLLLLFRRPQLEPIRMSLEERQLWMISLSKEPVYWDLDYPSQSDDLAFWSALLERPKLVLSHHDYQMTPSNEALEGLFAQMKAYHPSAIKLAAYCHSPQDAVRLLWWQLRLQEEGHLVILLGMGPHGAVTRIFGTLWGNAMIFAPPSLEQASAPGQLTQPQLAEIFALLGESFA